VKIKIIYVDLTAYHNLSRWQLIKVYKPSCVLVHVTSIIY